MDFLQQKTLSLSTTHSISQITIKHGMKKARNNIILLSVQTDGQCTITKDILRDCFLQFCDEQCLQDCSNILEKNSDYVIILDLLIGHEMKNEYLPSMHEWKKKDEMRD
jgi:hypothetical protein